MARAGGLAVSTTSPSPSPRVAEDFVASVNRDVFRARYAVTQSARVAWYAAHYLLAKRVSRPIDRPNEPPFRPKSPPGDQKRIRQAFLDVFAEDRANIEAGLYPAPLNLNVESTLAALENSLAFLRDLPRVDERRVARRGVEVRDAAKSERLPTYYLQNFHYQTGGWLTEESAKLYDTQVEVLFAGAADAMRRIALGELMRALKGQDQRRTRLLDVACGNGRFLSQILSALPRIRASGIDLSAPYLDLAQKALSRWPQVELINGAAEAIPLQDASLDAVTCVYLFHELPPRVRRAVASEFARTLKPGGVLIFADSLQMDDTPDLNQMLEYFPIGFHEPFYGSYQSENLAELFGEAGFDLENTRRAFLTKVMRFRRR
jgi:ubiquinone/menaquinone biosynthesis C-methylase UbiE